MIGQILFTIAMVIYWLSEGCTEGYTWADKTRRKWNKLICGRRSSDKDSSFKLDYHAWRLGENIGIVGCIFSVLLIPSFWSLLLTFLGSWMLGYFVYERALNYVVSGNPFVKKNDYHLMGITIPRSNTFDCIVAIIGLVLVILGIFI
jgi:hypothetical protein